MSASEHQPSQIDGGTSQRLGYARPAKRKPFTISNIVALLIMVLLLLAILIPALDDGPQLSPAMAIRLKSASNLKSIGIAMRMYANAHNHELPDSMNTILASGGVPPQGFVNPGSKDKPAAGPTTQAVLIDFAKPGHCSYLYFGTALVDTGDPTTVTACELPGTQCGPGMNVLLLDGHVEFLDGTETQSLRAALASGSPVAWTSTGGITRPTTQPTTRP